MKFSSNSFQACFGEFFLGVMNFTACHFCRFYPGDVSTVIAVCAAPWSAASRDFCHHRKWLLAERLRIRHRVPKHIEKEGLGEAVEQGQGGAAMGSEGFGLVEDGGDAALFF